MEDILTLRIVLAIIAASAFIGGLFGALLFIFNEYAWRRFRKAKLPVSREQNNRLPPTTN
jgi:predicted membrane protein